MDEFVFDGRNMDAFTRRLHESAVRLQAETDKTVALTGAMLAETAKRTVAPHSKSIQVHMEMVPGAAVIHGAAPDSPLARLYEKGNAKGAGRSGFRGKDVKKKYTARGLVSVKSFSHPVYAKGDRSNWAWAKQERYPFLAPARALMRSKLKPMMNEAWKRALEPLRIH